MARRFVSASTQYFDYPTASAIADAPFSISAWLYPTSGTENKYVFNLGKTGSNDRQHFYTGGGAVFCYSGNSSTFGQSSISGLTAGTWQQVGVMVTTNSLRNSIRNGTIGTNETTTINISGFDRMHIACGYNNGSRGGHSNDTIADIGLWNVALSAEEWAALAAGASPLLVRPSALVGYWPLRGRGTDEEDWVGGRLMSANNGPITVADSPRIIVPSSYLLIAEPVAASGTATDLTSQNADSAHSSESPSLTLSTTLAIANADSAHTAENVTLSTTGSTDLVAQDIAHAHAVDAPTLTADSLLAVQDAAHAHAVDNLTLGTTGVADLVAQDASHAHGSDALALTLDTTLTAQDATHAHAIDNVLVSIPGGTLDLILKILVNRQELNPATGTFTLYDDDGTTVLYTTSAWADAAGTVPYSGGALRRIDALF